MISFNPDVKFQTGRGISFKSRVISDFPVGSATKKVKELVDIFEEMPQTFERLGSGKCAHAHILSKPLGLVIKSSRKGLEKLNAQSFLHEAEMLDKVPAWMRFTQRLTSFVRTEKGNNFLVSTFLPGAVSRPFMNPMNSEKFHSLFSTLFDLDKAGIYHNDLSRKNVLFDGDNAGLIDYQWAQKFEPFGDNSGVGINFPLTIIPANVFNYEQSFAGYLFKFARQSKNEETYKLLRGYLSEKSVYHQKRYNYYHGLLGDKLYFTAEDGSHIGHNNRFYKPLKYERALYKVYQQPNQDVLDVEMLRMEFLRSAKKAYSYIDPNMLDDKNSFNAMPYIANSIYTLNHLRNRLEVLGGKYQDNKYMRRYIDWNNQIAGFFKDNYKSWFRESLDYIINLSTEHAYLNNDRFISPEVNKTGNFDFLESFVKVVSPANNIQNGNYPIRRFAQRSGVPGLLERLDNDVRMMLLGEKISHSVYKMKPNRGHYYNLTSRDTAWQIQRLINHINDDNPISAFVNALHARTVLNGFRREVLADDYQGFANSITDIGNDLEDLLHRGRDALIESLDNPKKRFSKTYLDLYETYIRNCPNEEFRSIPQ